jgi:inorganic pyrophosphatase/K(+)-stimulated pyrophosphate-energized sodium pump
MESLLLAATEAVQEPVAWMGWWILSLFGAVAGLAFAYRFYAEMKRADPGDESMVRIAGHVAEGARAYLRQQYYVVGVVFVAIAAILAVLSFVLEVQSKWIPFAFLSGGFFSALSGYFGMTTATAASNRTAAAARGSLNDALRVAFRSGAVMGLVVVGLGLFNICAWFLILFWIAPMFGAPAMGLEELTSTMLSAGLGASTQALFARVGGGIFTKAADVGADLVGKVEAGIPEDDPRNPATIADNVGDNVGDVAGMGADLFESYCGAILAASALSVPALGIFGGASRSVQIAGVLLPLVIAGVGVLVSILGVYFVRTREGADQHELLGSLERGMNVASLLGAVFGFFLTPLLLGIGESSYWLLGASILVGAGAGKLIALWTGVSTSAAYGPTKRISDQAEYGPATVIISGVAEGLQSTWAPTLVVAAGTLAAYGCGTWFDYSDPAKMSMGLFGIGIAAVGMLSTLGILLATDAYGPIADNAGGNAEMTHQKPEVRQRTDALDSLGNTTAAIGKGFAIGSAALTALALLAAYVEQVRISYDQWAKTVVAAKEAGRERDAEAYESWRKETAPGQPGAVLRAINGTTAVVIGRNLDFESRLSESAEAAARKEGDEERPFEAYIRVPHDPKDASEGYRFIPVSRATIRDFVDMLDVNPLNPRMLTGILVGAMLVSVFSALTMNAVGRSAGQMVAEVRRQFREIPGIMEGTGRPDYASCVRISTRAAQYEMLLPSILGIAAPVVTGLLLGVAGVVGLLAGAISSGFMTAIMMANAGGAWDNAKKYIESGAHGGKGSAAHKASVVGDTVGDPFKDTSGPSLNILIKLMSMISLVFVSLVVRMSL